MGDRSTCSARGICRCLGMRPVMDERLLFIAGLLRGELPMSVLCEQFGIGRKTGYKWLERYRADPQAGLIEIHEKSGRSWALGALYFSVHSIRIEAATVDAVFVREIDNPQDLLWSAREGDPILGRWDDIGLAFHLNTLIFVVLTIHLISRVRESIGGF